MTRMTVNDAHAFYGEHKGKSFFEKLVKFMTSGEVVGMELVAENAILKWRQLIGPTNSLVQSSIPLSLTIPFRPPDNRHLTQSEACSVLMPL